MVKRDKEFYNFQNRVMEKLALTKLSPNENKYCWALFRKTFGFGKYTDIILRGLMASLTGMDPTTVSHVKRRLIERNIIYQSSRNTGLNLDIGQWEKVKVSSLFEKVKVSSLKGEGRAEKKGEGIVTLQRTNKENSKEGGGGLKKLSIKEADKLEGKEWLKQVMWQRGKFSERFIDEIFKIYTFTQCYDTYIAYQDAHNVRDKEAWFLAKIRRGPEGEG